MEALHEVELLRLALALVGRFPVLVLVLELGVAPEPRQYFSRVRQVRIDDLTPHRPAALVLPRVPREVTRTPPLHRLGKEEGAAADVGRRLRGHRSDIDDELGVE